jgi:phage gp29-like protein
MAKKTQLVDQWNRPINRATLTTEVAAPTIGGVRSPISGYPGDGLSPLRLGQILREADQGDPVRFLELAEVIEERDAHYLGVLSTRKRSVAQIEITVEPGDDSAEAERHAEMVRKWLKRDELSDDLFNILDAIGKGYSFTEIIWDTSTGDWDPKRLEYRDPRWFRFERHDLRTPLMLSQNGQEEPLPGFRFIFACMKAKSGLPLRSGIARVAMWSYLFKKYTERDWAIFTQTYGQPLRVGKYGAGASEKDKTKLFQAVANIAGDCAAIVPESMMIDFIETSNLGASTNLYLERANWLDQQISKLVLGQTATTDAVTGGLGSGKEHRQVQEDIERADAREVASILNRDLIRPWVSLQFGPQKVYPRLIMARPEEEDLAAFSSAIAPLIDKGLRVTEREVLAKFGLSTPGDNDRILGQSAENPAAGVNAGEGAERGSFIKYQRAPIKYPEGNSKGDPRFRLRRPQRALPARPAPRAFWRIGWISRPGRPSGI